MRQIYSPEDIEKVLTAALARGYDFITEVGRACATEVINIRADRNVNVVVIAGDDNNGAFAIETAIELNRRGCLADLYLINIGGNKLKANTKTARDRFINSVGQGCLYETVSISQVKLPESSQGMIIVDGLFGREYKEPLRGGYQLLARRINDMDGFVVSIDLPSGMLPDLSMAMINRNIVHADLTLTLVGASLAFFMPENAELLGQWKVLNVPYPKDAFSGIKRTSRLISVSTIRSLLPHRDKFVSKADLGTALLYAGSYGMVGAAVLSAKAALRSGCGKVIVHAPRCGYYVLQTAVPCAMFETDGGDMEIRRFDSTIEADAIGVGPGIGRSDSTVKGLEQLLMTMNEAHQPIVLDADAINCMAIRPSMLDHVPARSVLTPHAGEFDRLFGSQPSSAARLLKAKQIAKKYNIIIVLKGYYTLTVWPNGTVAVNTSGTEALATPGSGDVLTGLLTGLMALHLQPEIAAVAAVYIHGIAGRLAAEENGIYGVTAEDVALAIGNAIELILNPPTKK